MTVISTFYPDIVIEKPSNQRVPLHLIKILPSKPRIGGVGGKKDPHTTREIKTRCLSLKKKFAQSVLGSAGFPLHGWEK